jgi:hypothetical protein
MEKVMSQFLTLLLSLGFVACTSTQMREPAAETQAVSPKLFFQPAPVFDIDCQARTGFKVDPQWQQELANKAGLFQNEWDQNAKALIETSEQMAGTKFSRKEYSVALTICKWTPMGHPFIVSVRPYLEISAKADPNIKQAHNMKVFLSMTHHELLHSLVDNILNFDFSNSSNIIIKYQKEPINVLVHLHLMAIQKATYEKMNNQVLIKNTDFLYNYIGGDYKRAWDIVNEEGTDKFLKELQAYNSKTK